MLVRAEHAVVAMVCECVCVCVCAHTCCMPTSHPADQLGRALRPEMIKELSEGRRSVRQPLLLCLFRV